MANPRHDYTAEAMYDDGRLTDVRIVSGGRTTHLAGRSGRRREEESALELTRLQGQLPVLLGAGLGVGLQTLLDHGDSPVAVVDAEAPILAATGVRERFADDPRVRFVEASDPRAVLNELSRWQLEHGGLTFAPLAHPAYLRLAPALYREVLDALTASRRAGFWEKARYAKFASWPPRVLLITSRYFIMGEIKAALERLDVPHLLLDVGGRETGCTEFVTRLLSAVVEFQPDFALTVNHLGVDREGVLASFLERLQLPLASWFVDNPHLILYAYHGNVSELTTVFTWDADNIRGLTQMGFSRVRHLPLGVDAERFRPMVQAGPGARFRADVSFVGNSMVVKTARRLEAADPPPALAAAWPELAEGFGACELHSVGEYIARHRPELATEFEAMQPVERRLAYETLVTWESTRRYRAGCLARLMPFNPLIVGDPGWLETFPDEGRRWRYRPELSYYDDLPGFYPQSTINFNCTSLQMKGAVNQRVFDVPACGAFLLTDHRRQMEDLFEPGREVAVFSHPDEIEELVAFYLDHPREREAITAAARKRILAEHTYDHRLTTLMRAMQEYWA